MHNTETQLFNRKKKKKKGTLQFKIQNLITKIKIRTKILSVNLQIKIHLTIFNQFNLTSYHLDKIQILQINICSLNRIQKSKKINRGFKQKIQKFVPNQMYHGQKSKDDDDYYSNYNQINKNKQESQIRRHQKQIPLLIEPKNIKNIPVQSHADQTSHPIKILSTEKEIFDLNIEEDLQTIKQQIKEEKAQIQTIKNIYEKDKTSIKKQKITPIMNYVDNKQYHHSCINDKLSQQNKQETIKITYYPKSSFLIELPPQRNLKEFLLNPLPQGKIMKCFVKQIFYKFDKKFELFHDERLLMVAQSQRGNIGCNYHITLNGEMNKYSQFYLGNVRGNFLGSDYNIYSYTGGEDPKKCSNKQKWRKLVGNIQYKANFLGFGGPRKFTVNIPSDQQQIYNPQFFQINSTKTLKQLSLQFPNCMRHFKNKEAQWNPTCKSYTLNFGQKVKKSSKNFILQDIKNPQKNILVFGKLDDNLFRLEFQYPFSPFQAFGIILTSFDGKLISQ